MAGAVKGNVAAAVAFGNLNAAPGEEFGRGENICRFGVAAESDDRCVLEKQEYIADAVLFAEFD